MAEPTRLGAGAIQSRRRSGSASHRPSISGALPSLFATMTRRRTSRRLFQASPAARARPPESEEEVPPERTIASLPDALLLEVRSRAGSQPSPAQGCCKATTTSLRQHAVSVLRLSCLLTSPSRAGRRRRGQHPAVPPATAAVVCLVPDCSFCWLQVFRQLARLPPVTDPEEEALYSRRLPFRTFESPGEVRVLPPGATCCSGTQPHATASTCLPWRAHGDQ